MRCFKWKEKFALKRYNKICPKSGTLCQNETMEKCGQDSQKNVKKQYNISTLYFRICICISVLVFIGSMVFSVIYMNVVQKKALAAEPELQEHALGKAFSFRDMTLTVSDAKILDAEERTDFPLAPGKKLVAVKLLGKGDGDTGFKNYIPSAYIRYKNLCYWQISAVHGYQYANGHKIKLFELAEMCGSVEGEGWLIFWLDSDENEFTLCLEERIYRDAVIQKIHSIPICLEEDRKDNETI